MCQTAKARGKEFEQPPAASRSDLGGAALHVIPSRMGRRASLLMKEPLQLLIAAGGGGKGQGQVDDGSELGASFTLRPPLKSSGY